MQQHKVIYCPKCDHQDRMEFKVEYPKQIHNVQCDECDESFAVKIFTSFEFKIFSFKEEPPRPINPPKLEPEKPKPCDKHSLENCPYCKAKEAKNQGDTDGQS